MKRLALLIPAALLAATGGVLAQGGAAPTPGARVTVVSRASATVTGQPLGLPRDPWEMVISIAELPPGGTLPMHKHPWPRYAFVEHGRLSVTYEAAGITREFGPGAAVAEAIDAWHEARVIGAEPLRLILFDQVPRGASNVVAR